MTYIDYLNDFNRWLESGNLPGGSQLMYFKLLNVFNRAGWPEYVQVDNLRMMLMIGVESKQAVVRAREKLVETGFIEFQKGKKEAQIVIISGNGHIMLPKTLLKALPFPYLFPLLKTLPIIRPRGRPRRIPPYPHRGKRDSEMIFKKLLNHGSLTRRRRDKRISRPD